MNTWNPPVTPTYTGYVPDYTAPIAQRCECHECTQARYRMNFAGQVASNWDERLKRFFGPNDDTSAGNP